MGCNRCNKPTLECGDKVYAPCVYVEIDFPIFSIFHEEECVTLDEVVEELYKEVDEIKEAINIESFNSCLEYEEKTIPIILQKHEDEICDLKNKLTPCEILNLDISDCGIDVSCLGNDPCNNVTTVTTIGALFQTLIERICELENK